MMSILILETCQITVGCLVTHFTCHQFNSAISETFQFTQKNKPCTPYVPMFNSCKYSDVGYLNKCNFFCKYLDCWQSVFLEISAGIMKRDYFA